jgi:hypothetical protein
MKLEVGLGPWLSVQQVPGFSSLSPSAAFSSVGLSRHPDQLALESWERQSQSSLIKPRGSH